MSAEVVTQPALHVSKARTLFRQSDLTSLISNDSYSYGMTADGRRFLAIAPDPRQQGPKHLNLVQGWLEELKRRVPSGGR